MSTECSVDTLFLINDGDPSISVKTVNFCHRFEHNAPKLAALGTYLVTEVNGNKVVISVVVDDLESSSEGLGPRTFAMCCVGRRWQTTKNAGLSGDVGNELKSGVISCFVCNVIDINIFWTKFIVLLEVAGLFGLIPDETRGRHSDLLHIRSFNREKSRLMPQLLEEHYEPSHGHHF